MTNLNKITLHWTVTGYKATATSKKHYHFITEGDGTLVHGNLKPEDNLNTSTPYAAHVRGFNTGNIGMAVAAMVGAKERPFKAGNSPITVDQLFAFSLHVAQICKKYGIPVTRQTVFTHGEVESRFGVKQNGKWDINWLPGMQVPETPEKAGDALRAMIQMHVDDLTPKPKQSPWAAILLAIASIFRRKL